MQPVVAGAGGGQASGTAVRLSVRFAGSMQLVTALVAVISVLVGIIVLDREEGFDLGQPSVVLGDPKYDYEAVQAPIASGAMLRAFSYVLTRSRLGRLIRRHLLLGNGVTKLRELASQTSGVAPLHFPVRRLNSAQRSEHDRESAGALFRLDELIAPGKNRGGGSGCRGVGPSRNSSRVMAYHRAFLASAGPATEEIRESFAAFTGTDDSSGALDDAEFRTVLTASHDDAAAPLTDTEVHAVFKRVDKDKSGECYVCHVCMYVMFTRPVVFKDVYSVY